MEKMKSSGKKIILASGSPRRKRILSDMGLEFEVISSNYEEVLENLEFSYEKIEDLAYCKGKSVVDILQTDALVLSADTVVVLDNQILGKPKDRYEAFKMLEMLSGKKHFVVTSVCIIDSKSFEKKMLSETSHVEFEELSPEMINYYINEFNPLDKAGAYGIQELPENFVKNIEGSFENIIGLCPRAVERLLNLHFCDM